MHSSSAAAGVRRAIRAGLAALVLALAGAAPAAAQTLFQGRIDITVQDAQERAVPGAIGRDRRPGHPAADHRRQRRGPLPQSRAGQLRRHRDAAGIHHLPQRDRARRRGVERAAPRHAAGRRRGGDRAGQCRRSDRRSGPPDRDDRRVVRGAAAAAVGARSVGHPADDPRRRRRSRQRRRSRVGPAVELPGEGRRARREHLEPRRHSGDGSRGHRQLADLLQLRHVPGDERHDRRRVGDQSDGRRAAEHAVQDRREPAERRGASLRRRRRPAEQQSSRRSRRPGRPERQGQSHEGPHRLRLRPRRPDHARQVVGVGLVRAHREHAVHAERRSRQDHARERRAEVDRADHAAHPSGVPVLPRQQDQDRPRREPAARAGDDLGSERPDAALSRGR